MSKFSILLEGLLFLILSLVLLLFGAGIPVHFRALAPSVLTKAGSGSGTIVDLSSSYLDAGKVGPVDLLSMEVLSGVNLERFRDQRELLVEKHPVYRISGGPSAYFERYLDFIDTKGSKQIDSRVIPFLLDATYRKHLLRFLENSSNSTVARLLITRSLTSVVRFMPVSTAAGQPLDATILMTALLIQGDDFSSELTKEIRREADGAIRGELLAVDKLESAYISLLAFGRRMNWVQLTEWTVRFQSIKEMEEVADLIRSNEEEFPLIYSLILLVEEPSAIVRYFEKFGLQGWKDLRFALAYGVGAVHELIKRGKSIYQPPVIFQTVDRWTTWVRQTPLLSFTHRYPQAAINLKIVVMLVAGYALALFLSNLLEFSTRRRLVSRANPLFVLRNSIVALFFTVTLWGMMEPTLFDRGPEPKAQLRLVFDVVNRIEALKSQNLLTPMLDQITILIILIFFLLQLVVYVFCLIRISEIKRRKANSDLKIKLLENEDNLFDLGLYIGLGGTVASLILLAVDVVQASLIAAYSSTLFGIIFVAILKVFHVRPYRRTLILGVETSVNE